MTTLADWSLPAASFIAPVLGSDKSACPADENYILISRPSCPTNGVHLRGAGHHQSDAHPVGNGHHYESRFFGVATITKSRGAPPDAY